VTAGWERVPGIDGMTRFSGKPVRAVRDVRDYLSDDLVPAVASTQDDFNDLESKWPPVDVFPPLLLAIGLIVLLYGGLMTLSARREGPGPRPSSSSSPGDGP
jgi:hypothetical protein